MPVAQVHEEDQARHELPRLQPKGAMCVCARCMHVCMCTLLSIPWYALWFHHSHSFAYNRQEAFRLQDLGIMVVPRQRILPRHYQRLARCIYHACTLFVAAVVTVTCSLLYTTNNDRVGRSSGHTGSTSSSWTSTTSRCMSAVWHSPIDLAVLAAGSFGPMHSRPGDSSC